MILIIPFDHRIGTKMRFWVNKRGNKFFIPTNNAILGKFCDQTFMEIIKGSASPSSLPYQWLLLLPQTRISSTADPASNWRMVDMRFYGNWARACTLLPTLSLTQRQSLSKREVSRAFSNSLIVLHPLDMEPNILLPRSFHQMGLNSIARE